MGFERIRKPRQDTPIQSPGRKPTTQAGETEVVRPTLGTPLFPPAENTSIYALRSYAPGASQNRLLHRTRLGKALGEEICELREAVHRGRLRAVEALDDATRIGHTNRLQALRAAGTYGARTYSYEVDHLSAHDPRTGDAIEALSTTRISAIGSVTRHILDLPHSNQDIARYRRQALDALILVSGRQTQDVIIDPGKTKPATLNDFALVVKIIERIQEKEPDAISQDALRYLYATAIDARWDWFTAFANKEPTLADRISDIRDSLAGKVETVVAVASVLRLSQINLLRDLRTSTITRLLKVQYRSARSNYFDSVLLGDPDEMQRAQQRFVRASDRLYNAYTVNGKDFLKELE